MKKQIGVWVDGQVWHAFRDLCRREGLRPAEPLEKFIRFVLLDGSALAVMNWLDNAGRTEGLEAYARVLLNWYKSGIYWISTKDEEEVAVDWMLLSVLKDVPDPELRRMIEDALTEKASEKEAEQSEKQKKAEEEITKKIKELRDLVKGS